MKKLHRKSDTMNLLDIIEKESFTALDDCKGVSKGMVIRPEGGAEKNEHFYARAEDMIAGVMGTTVYFGQEETGTRSLVHVANILSNPTARAGAMTLMQQNPQIWGGALARMGGQMSTGGAEELASVNGNVSTAIGFMNTPGMAASLQKSSFDLRALRREKYTAFIVLPVQFAQSHSAFLRLTLHTFMDNVIRGGLNQQQIHNFIIDEAKTVGAGRMDCIKNMVNVGRGYSIRGQLYYQDFGQAEADWGRAGVQGLLANTTCIAMAVNDLQTAQMLSARIGSETVVVESGGTNWGTSQQYSGGQIHSQRSNSSGGGSNWGQ